MVAAKGEGHYGVKHNQRYTTLLKQKQENTLLWTREEEKLARDVYLTQFIKWNKPVLNNIASSEQKHMDSI